MDLIYTNARAVYSCIDHPANCSNLFRWLRKETPHHYEKTSAGVDLKRLFSLRYFTRVWVIQEVALARVAYLVVNNDVLPLTAAVIEQMKKLYSGGPEVTDYHELPSVLRWSLGQRMKLGIVSCLHTSRSCHATDPRDHVYAVIGLMEDKAKALIPVDYSLDLQTVYRNVIAAVITTRQDLGILLFSGVGDHNPIEDWRKDSCVNMAAFGYYLHSLMRSSRTGRTRPFEFLSYDNNGSIITWDIEPFTSLSLVRRRGIIFWRAKISVLVLSPSEFCDDSKYDDASCFIETPEGVPFGLLPRLRVRAHYIDSINIGQLDVMITGHFTKKLGTNDERVLDCFQIDAPTSDILTPEKQLNTHFKDLRHFLMKGINSPTSRSWRIFSSHFSIGYRPHNVQTDGLDEIFAIDGAKELFIMRRYEDQKYRVVSPCYLWAAWELDCWNPGSKKGRWGPDVKRPTREQTRMIEIY